ncbi:2-amino-4-hydroxy-6-hydroxymethyldihydropteridine diphosphokinase, partial [Streptococcus suis]
NIEQVFELLVIEKCGQRIIDLDIFFLDEEKIQEENMIVPHPYAHERAFVLKPLAEIGSDYSHPILKKVVSYLIAELGEQ